MKAKTALFLLVPVFILHAQGLVDYSKQADLLVKLLNYNRSVLSGSDDLRIGLVYTEQQESINYFQQMSDALFNLITDGRKVGKRGLSFSAVAFTSADKLEQSIKQLNLAVLVISPGNDANIQIINQLARQNKILTFSSVGAYLGRGVATGVENVGGQVKIVVNLNLAKSQGANFKAELLQVARVIR